MYYDQIDMDWYRRNKVEDALLRVIDFVERYNKKDEEKDIADDVVLLERWIKETHTL